MFGSEFTENSKDLVAAVDRWVAILKSEGISSALSLLIPEHVSATSAYEAMKLRLLNGGYCALAFGVRRTCLLSQGFPISTFRKDPNCMHV